MERTRWDDVWMGLARSLAGRTSCKRAGVGCLVVSQDNHRVLAIGYNGNYQMGPNTCDTDEPGACGCLHAEENALIKLDYGDPAGKKMYTTTSPCLMCAKRIINAGIREVIYETEYRKRDGIELLKSSPLVFVHQFLPLNIDIEGETT